MKILFVDQSAKLGGAELSLIDVVQAFPQSSSVLLFQDGPLRDRLEKVGVSVEVIDHNDSKTNKESGLVAGIQSVFSAFPLIRQIAARAKSYDYIYANTQKAFVFSSIASILSGRPLIYHLRDILSEQHFSALNLSVIKFFANRVAKLVIANSQATQKSFLDIGGNPNKIHVVYNGFDPQVYAADLEHRSKLRRQLNLEDKFVIGHFSRLSPWKGQHVLLEALQNCPDSTVALLVGDALFGEDDYVKELKSQVQNLGLNDRVHFLGFRSDIPALMTACDVVTHTSIAPEPFGRVIVEAMFCGTPVIAAAEGGAAELVQSGKTGWAIPAGNVEALAQTLNHCYQAPALMKSMAHQAKTYASQNFHVNRLQQEVVNLIDSL